MKHINYVILNRNIIETLDFSLKRGIERVYIERNKESIRYNTNKFFFQSEKGIVKFRGKAPKEIEGYKQYNHKQILKKINSSWGQWKIKLNKIKWQQAK